MKEDLNSEKLLNHVSLQMLGTLNLSLEAKFVGRLYQYTDQSLKTCHRSRVVR